ncbi:hypothetical protein AB3N58_17500 (plasmid) [Leptospira sp. WS60.C2]
MSTLLLGVILKNEDFIYFEPTPREMNAGETQKLSIKLMLKNGSILDITNDPELVVQSSDTSIVTASGTTITSIVSGSASITASYKEKLVSAGIRVNGSSSLPTPTPADTTPPTVISAAAISPSIVRVTFSENVNVTNATNISNYRIVFQSDIVGMCSDNSNFTSTSIVGTLGSASNTNLGFSIASVNQIDGKTYDLVLSHDQFPGASYSVIVNKLSIIDLATIPNSLGCANAANFVGDEAIKVISATCVNTTNVVLSFSKPVLGGVGNTGTSECDTTSTPNCTDLYKLSASLGNVQSVRKLNGTVCGGLPADSKKVCINHSLPQAGSSYSIQVADETNADGFDNGTIKINSSTIPATSIIPASDNATFTGCGTIPVNFSDGALLDDPFGDNSVYGDLTVYLSNIVIGPNSTGSKAARFAVDGSALTILTFSLPKDTNTGSGSRTQQNTFGGMLASTAFNYSSIGRAGCSTDSGIPSNSCGPNNQDGRGVFFSGVIGGMETLFLTGSKSRDGAGYPQNDYIYWTRDSDTVLDFQYIDTGAILNVPPVNGSSVAGATYEVKHNAGSESMAIHNNYLYVSYPGTDPKRPTILRLQDITDPEPVPSLINRELSLFAMTNIGMIGSNAWNTLNLYQILGGTLYSFNSRIYLANTGNLYFNGTTCSYGSSSTYSATCLQKGGVIRSTNLNPSSCSGFGICSDWVDISPTSARYVQNFSNPLTRVLDLKAGDRPIPSFETFNGKLFMIRNACRTVVMKGAYYWAPAIFDEGTCPVGNERPQLWKCNPAANGSTTDCDADDWSLVAEDAVTTGASNFGDTANRRITLLKKNGEKLYVGFNNPNGIQVFRTKSGITDPTSASDFEFVSGPSGSASFNSRFVQEIYSAVSRLDGTIYNLYISVGGKNGASSVPVKVYRQINN